MAAFRDFDRFILPYMANPPLFAVDDALRDAAIDFCTRARVITQTSDPLPIVPGQPEIDVEVNGDFQPANVVAAYSSRGKLTPKTKTELDQIYPNGWMRETASEPGALRYWFAPRREVVRLVPYPTFAETQGLTLEVAVKPTRDASDLPDELLDHYAEAIAAGAMARLHAQPLASYANPARVEGYAGLFEAAVYRAADEHLAGVGKPQMRTGGDEFV